MTNTKDPPRNTRLEQLQAFGAHLDVTPRRDADTKKIKKEPTPRDKYFGEEMVHYGIVFFMLFTGWWLAWITGADGWSRVGQLFGFSVTTVLIITTYKGLKEGKYRGGQRVFARNLYGLLLVDEGITIFAKYYPPFRPYYLMWIAISIPILAYSAFKLITMDEEIELETVKMENKMRAKFVVEIKDAKKKQLALSRELAVVKAAENTHGIYQQKLLSKSTGWNARSKCNKAVKSGMEQVYDLIGFIASKRAGGEAIRLETLELTAHSGDGSGPVKKG